MNDFATVANRVRAGVTVTATAILIFVLWVSKDHITDIAHFIGLHGYQAATLFVLVDIVALVGKVLNTRYFAKSTRAMGFKLMLGAGAVSLLCNVAAGILPTLHLSPETMEKIAAFGGSGYGVFIVGLFVVLEQVVVRIKPAAAVTAAKTRAAKAAAAAAPKLTPAQRGAQTRKANAAAAVKTPKAPAAAPVSPATTAALEDAYSLPSAPVSGA